MPRARDGPRPSCGRRPGRRTRFRAECPATPAERPEPRPCPGCGTFAAAEVSCQRMPRPPMSESLDAGVEGDRLGQSGEGRGLGVDAGVEAERLRRARRGRGCWSGLSPGRPAEGRTRWRRPSGWVTVPSFSAWVSSGKTTSALAVVAFSCIEKQTTKSAAVRAASQAGVSGKSRSGSTPKRIRPFSSPDYQRGADLLGRLPDERRSSAEIGPARGRGRRRGGSRPRAGRGRWRCRGFRAGRRRRCRPCRVRRRGRAGRSAPSPSRAIRSPQMTTTLPALAQALGQRRGDVLGAADGRRQLGEEVGAPRRGRSGRSPRRRRRARSGARSRRPAGRRCGGSPCGRAGRGSASCAAGRCRGRGSRRPRRCRAPWPRSLGWARRTQRLARRARARGASRRAASRAPRAAAAGPGSPPRWRRRRRSPRPCRRRAAGPSAAAAIACLPARSRRRLSAAARRPALGASNISKP